MIKKFTKQNSNPVHLPSYIPPTLTTQPLPLLIVFDLDYTLWPFWVDTHPLPPFRPSADHTSATDKLGEPYAFYDDSPAILHSLLNHLSVKVAAASRTHAPDRARELLKMLWVYAPNPTSYHPYSQPGGSPASLEDPSAAAAPPAQQAVLSKKEKPKKAIDFFDAGLEIYPGSKMTHFEALHRKTGIAYADMLFFDDEARNREVESLGVTMRLVKDGMTWAELEKGVLEWRRRRSS